jgi:hypothetical protein
VSVDRWAPFGAAAGAIAIALFVAGGLVIGGQPDFDAPGSEIAEHLDEKQTRIQIGCALNAALAPFLIWFLATATSLARDAGPAARRTAAVAFGCGLVYVALFLADNAALATSALRPENMAADPELAAALRDLEWMAIGMASFLGAGVLAAVALLILRDEAVWPGWVGWLAAVCAPLYALRAGVLFTTDGPFAADSVLGLYLPAGAFATWILLASIVLAVRLRSSAHVQVQASGGGHDGG